MCSRTLAYYLLKRFGEVDPARAYVKVTHTRLANLPIPVIRSNESLGIVEEIEKDVRLLIQRQDHGGQLDHRIEQHLRQLWGLEPEEGAYINSSFSILPQSQPVRDLFPDGPPPVAGGRRPVGQHHARATG